MADQVDDNGNLIETLTSKRKHDKTDTEVPKKKKYLQSYKESYNVLWPCLRQSKRGENMVFCSVCNTNFSCGHAGKNDCFRHVQSKQHKDLSKLKESNASMTSFMNVPSNSELDRQRAITRAETLMCELIAELNLPLTAADTFNQAFKLMFPDSKIAEGMKCGRNKATAILVELANMKQKELSGRMNNNAFSISTDGSNDASSKQYPIVVRTRDSSTGLVDSELLSIPVCNDAATGENIFNLVNNDLKSHDVDWVNCVALGCDNANVMTGRHKGVFAYVKEEQPNVFLSGCVLHLIHIAAKKAADQCLPPIDDVLIDIYYYFNKSDSRKLAFKGTQDLYDVGQRKMFKHVCTRWLSIGRCMERLLVNWDPLKDYFYEQDKILKEKAEKAKKSTPKDSANSKANPSTSKDSVSSKKNRKTPKSNESQETKEYSASYAEKKVEAVFTFVKSPTNKLYVIFLNYTIHVYDEVLRNLQAEEPMVHVLRKSLHSVMRNILVRFVKPSAIVGKSVDQVEYKLSYNQKVDKELVIGEEAKRFIEEKEKNHLRDSRLKEFYSNVRQYFAAACDYIKKNLPLNDPVLCHAEVADTDKQVTAKASSLEFFMKRYPCLVPEGVTVNVILEEFALYQSFDIKVETAECKRIDEKWNAVGKIKNEAGIFLFANLASVMCGILCIPHSSAHCERVFSVVRKNRTDQRASLGDKTVESLLVLMLRPGHPCDASRQHSNKTLDKLKGAYYRQLKH